jgi:hypothetical protein
VYVFNNLGLSPFFCEFIGLYEPGGVLGGWGPKMCKTRVWGVLGGYRGF